jgi:hypothetical protein
MRRLIPNFYIHISVSDLYIPRNGPPIFVQPNWQTQRLGIHKLLTEYINVEIRTEAAQFPYWEHFFPIFGQVSLQVILFCSIC